MRRPAWRARTAQSAREAPLTGMKGMTSAAPMRGWTPFWLGEVDEFGGFACGADRGFDDAGGSACDGDDGAIVRGVERPVEEADAFNLHGGDDLLDLGCVGSFREVGDAFDDGFRIHFETRSSTSLRAFYFHQVYPRENWTLALTPGLRSPSEALEMWMALAPKSMERRGRRK